MHQKAGRVSRRDLSKLLINVGIAGSGAVIGSLVSQAGLAPLFGVAGAMALVPPILDRLYPPKLRNSEAEKSLDELYVQIQELRTHSALLYSPSFAGATGPSPIDDIAECLRQLRKQIPVDKMGQYDELVRLVDNLRQPAGYMDSANQLASLLAASVGDSLAGVAPIVASINFAPVAIFDAAIPWGAENRVDFSYLQRQHLMARECAISGEVSRGVDLLYGLESACFEPRDQLYLLGQILAFKLTGAAEIMAPLDWLGAGEAVGRVEELLGINIPSVAQAGKISEKGWQLLCDTNTAFSARYALLMGMAFWTESVGGNRDLRRYGLSTHRLLLESIMPYKPWVAWYRYAPLIAQAVRLGELRWASRLRYEATYFRRASDSKPLPMAKLMAAIVEEERQGNSFEWFWRRYQDFAIDTLLGATELSSQRAKKLIELASVGSTHLSAPRSHLEVGIGRNLSHELDLMDHASYLIIPPAS